MVASNVKRALVAFVALPLVAFASGAYACQVVGYANGEALCSTTSDASGYNNASQSPGRIWNQRHATTSVLSNAAPLCPSGLVWRGAAAAGGDGVCVTPQERTIAQQQNANAANNMAGGGAYGPMTCRQGYVWREAYQGDTVCVTPYERSEAQRQNAGH